MKIMEIIGHEEIPELGEEPTIKQVVKYLLDILEKYQKRGYEDITLRDDNGAGFIVSGKEIENKDI